MKRVRKYIFVTSPVFLGIFLMLLYISALYIPVENNERWIPALIGFLDFESISKSVSIIIASVFLISTAISLFIFNERNLMIGHRGIMLPVIYLIFAVASPKTLYFSGISVASLFVVWSLYYSLFSRKGDKEMFIAGFLIAVAALFDPHVTLLMPLIIFYSLRSSVLTARGVAVMIGSVMVPFIFMFSFRYLFFDDALFFGEIYLTDLKDICYPRIGLKNVADIVLALTTSIYLVFAISNSLSNINRYKILKSNSFSRFISWIVFSALIMVFYPKSGEAFIQILAIPGSVLVAEYITQTEKPTRKRVGFLLVLIFLSISRIASLI